MTYVDSLMTPLGQPVTFDDLFTKLQEETKIVWGQLAQAITASDAGIVKLPNGDFDSGLDLADGQTSVFWRQTGETA